MFSYFVPRSYSHFPNRQTKLTGWNISIGLALTLSFLPAIKKGVFPGPLPKFARPARNFRGFPGPLPKSPLPARNYGVYRGPLRAEPALAKFS